MAFKVRPRDIVRLLREAKYLEELAYTAMESFDEGRYWVESEREQRILEGNYVGIRAEPGAPSLVRPGPDPCGK
jgi:hypothetical protein